MKSGSAFSFIFSGILVCVGLYKMFVYDDFYGTNAYVRGDAYNYIINAGYAVGFFVLAVLFAIVGFTCVYIYYNETTAEERKAQKMADAARYDV